MSRKRAFLALVLATSAATTAARADARVSFRIAPGPATMSAEEKAIAPDPSKGMQHGVVLLEESERDDPLRGYAKTSYHMRAKILSSEGRALGDIQIPFDAKHGWLREWWGKVILPDGTVLDLPKDKLAPQVLVEEAGGRLHVLKGALPGIVPGCVVDFGWVFQDHSFRFDRRIDLQGPWFVKHFRYRWLPARGALSKYHVLRRPGLQIDVIQEKDITVVEGRDLPPVAEEPWMPPSSLVRAGITFFYEFSNSGQDPRRFWDEVARKSRDHMEEFLKDEPLKRAIAGMNLPQSASPLEKTKAAYEWVRVNLKNRWLTTSEDDEALGEEEDSKKTPESLEDVLDKKEGSTGQITHLVLGLARALGAEANLVLAEERTTRYWDPNLLDDSQLGEKILAVRDPGEPIERSIFLDPAEGYPWGEIRWQLTPSRAMLVTKEGGREIVLRGADAAHNLLETKGRIELSEDGASASAQWSIRAAGQVGRVGRRLLRWDDPEERKEHLEERCGASGAFDVESAEAPGLNDPVAPWALECRGSLTLGAPAGDGSHLSLPLDGPWIPPAPLFPAETRVHPVVFDFPWSGLTTLEVAASSGWKPVPALRPVTIEAPFGRYSLSVSATGSGYQVRREFVLAATTVKVDAYPALRDFLAKIHMADAEPLRFERAGGTTP